MGSSTHTIKVDADTTDTEAKLERLVALAERFKELWGDAPMPDGVESFVVNKGDRVLFRYDGQLTDANVAKIRDEIKRVMPEIDPVVLAGGLRLDGVLTGPLFGPDARPEGQVADKRDE